MNVLDIDEMGRSEIESVLHRVHYGHLGCIKDGRPYVIPIHYAYETPYVYLYTTRGMKTEYIAANPQVCLQVEDVRDVRHWQSVIVAGSAELLSGAHECERAMQAIERVNPTLTPAISRTWTDVWGRANITEIYRIKPELISGRETRRNVA